MIGLASGKTLIELGYKFGIKKEQMETRKKRISASPVFNRCASVQDSSNKDLGGKKHSLGLSGKEILRVWSRSAGRRSLALL